MDKPTWYLLYGGTSVDGFGPGEYVGRTESLEEAIKHNRKCRENPYSTGYVVVIDDTRVEHIWRY